MPYLTDELKQICTNNLLMDKVLVVPSHSAGHQIMKMLADAGSPVLNLRTVMLGDLASSMAGEYLADHDICSIDRTTASHLIYFVLRKMWSGNSLAYIGRLNIMPGIARIICSAVLELKHAGLKPDDISSDCFVDEKKAKDLKEIFKEYEKCLKDRKLADEADIYSIGCDNNVTAETIYMIYSNYNLSHLQEKFLKAISGDSLIVLNMPDIPGIRNPGARLKNKGAGIKANIIAGMFSRDLAGKADIQMEISKAYGEGNEVKRVLRDIKKGGLSLDSCAVYSSTAEPYCQLFYNMVQKEELPVTFSNGISASNTKPYKFIKIMLRLIEHNFKVSDFLLLIESNLLKFDLSAVSANDMQYILRRARIGWGKSRYDTQLENLEREIAKSTCDTQTLYKIQHIRNMLEGIFKGLPEAGTAHVSINTLVKALERNLNTYCRITCDLDAEAVNSLNEVFDNICLVPDITCSISEAINILHSLLEVRRVGASPPKPGHIHIADYRKDLWVDRDNSFVIGLDSQKFPGRAAEDPVLLDAEKKKLGIMNYSRDLPEQSIHDMVLMLSLLEGSLHISSSSYDISENREISPCALLLNLYRLKENNYSADYTKMESSIKVKSGFIPSLKEEITDEAEWWMFSIIKEKMTEGIIKCLEDSYSFYRYGAEASKNRSGSLFTEYDGRITPIANELDPRNNNAVLSCSHLELLAKCPYAYFTRYVLGVYPPDYLSFNEGEWLNHAEKGKVYHRIFQRFYENLNAKKEKPLFSKHIDMLCTTAEEVLKEMADDIPPPGDHVFQYERQLFLDSCRVFLRFEEEHSGESDPVYLEYSFGTKQNTRTDPVRIKLPQGSTFYLSGKIDRIDRLKNHTWRIIDYKTGSTYAFSENTIFNRGRQLQHALYSIAAERLLSSSSPVRVTEGCYVFPTIKGEGKRYIYASPDRDILYNILTDLFDIMCSGAFAMMPDDNNCKYCEYKSICRYISPDSHPPKKTDNNTPGLDIIRRLENYA